MKRILVVEDQADIRALIRMTLEIEEFDVHEAADGASGLAAARSLRPQLILLDVMMPGKLDGIGLCEQVRVDPALHGTRIVMLSARALPEDRERGLRAGADAYLSKPFSPLQLLELVDSLTCG